MHGLIAASFWLHDLWHPLAGRGYQFWSGIGSDFAELGIIGGLITIVRGLNCHQHRCWRLGKHPVDGSPYRVCRKHHPNLNGKITQQDIEAAAKSPVQE